MDPSAQVLNYGQSIFEGMKAQRTAGGNIVLFRPDENAARMMAGAHQWHSLLLHTELSTSRAHPMLASMLRLTRLFNSRITKMHTFWPLVQLKKRLALRLPYTASGTM